MTAPQLDRACASAVLALVSAAKAHAPGCELAWLLGWAMRAAGEPVTPRPDPRVDPEPEPNGVPVAKVPLTRRPT
jgi:hypothetical protein